ncbi:MAG TPA: hypothetical protein VFX49_11815 [Chloroflexota bacterium]|nr:hypothetical protein [Chloroflexota bacterium]
MGLILAALIGFAVFYAMSGGFEERNGLVYFSEGDREKVLGAFGSISLELASPAEADLRSTTSAAFRLVRFSPVGAPATSVVEGAKLGGHYVAASRGVLDAIEAPQIVNVFVVVCPEGDVASVAGPGRPYAILYDPKEG